MLEWQFKSAWGHLNKMRDIKKQLGINLSTATNKLRKELLFFFISQLELNKCYRCSKIITNVNDFYYGS